MRRRLKKRALRFALGRDGDLTPVLISGIRHLTSARASLGPEHGRQWLVSEEAVDLLERYLNARSAIFGWTWAGTREW